MSDGDDGLPEFGEVDEVDEAFEIAADACVRELKPTKRELELARFTYARRVGVSRKGAMRTSAVDVEIARIILDNIMSVERIADGLKP